MKQKRFMRLLLVLLLTIASIAGCGTETESLDSNGAETNSSETDSISSGTEKTQLNVATELLSATLDPAINWDSWFVMRWGAGETLVKFADDGSFEPWLAKSWEVAADNLTWTFWLKDGVTFSNGAIMTATKVAESIKRLYEAEDPANGGTGNPQGYFTYEELIADDDANTLTIVTTEPVPDMPGCMAYPWTMIIDVEGSSDRDLKTEGPICTGPYAFASFTQDNDVQMVRNEYYWDGEVPFETVNVMKVGEASTRTMALQDGSADIALSISAADRELLLSDQGYLVSSVAGSRIGYAHVNMDGVLGHDALRQAVMMAIDGQTIADVTTSASYTYGYAVVPSNFDYGYEELSYEFTYDPEQAEALLDEAGIVDTDGDGYRELDGETIVLDYKVTDSRQMDLIGQAQAAQLEAIGIKCTVQVTETQSDVLNNSTFDLCCSNEVTTPTGDPANFMKHWYSGSDDNYANYENPEYDAIYEALAAEFDPEKRRDYIISLQQILLDDAAVLVYGYYNYNLCATDAITGAYCPSSDYYWVTKDVKPAGEE